MTKLLISLSLTSVFSGCDNDVVVGRNGDDASAVDASPAPADVLKPDVGLTNDGASVNSSVFRSLEDMEGTMAGLVPGTAISKQWFTVGQRCEKVPPAPKLAQPDDMYACRANVIPLKSQNPIELAVALRPSDGSANQWVDLSAYAGIMFWVHGADSEVGVFRVSISDGSVVALKGENASSLENEGRSFFSRQLQLQDTWQRYVVLWEDFNTVLEQSDRKLDPTSISSIHWTKTGPDARQLWLNDVSLVCRGACP